MENDGCDVVRFVVFSHDTTSNVISPHLPRDHFSSEPRGWKGMGGGGGLGWASHLATVGVNYLGGGAGWGGVGVRETPGARIGPAGQGG